MDDFNYLFDVLCLAIVEFVLKNIYFFYNVNCKNIKFIKYESII